MALLVENTLLEVIIFIISILTVGYFYVKHLYSYWERHNVKCLKPVFPFGNFHLLGKMSLMELLRHFYESTSEDYIGVYALFRPILVIKNAELVRHILVKDFQSFHDRGIYVNLKNDPLSGHLFALSGQEWKQLRVKITPTFTAGKMKAMFSTFSNSGDSLLKFLNKKVDGRSEIDFRDLMAKYTVNNITSIVFGVEMDSINEPDNDFNKYGRKAVTPSLEGQLRILLFLIFPRVAEFIKMKTMVRDYDEFIFRTVRQIVSYREENNVSRKDFMQLLLQLRNSGKVSQDGDFSLTKTNVSKTLTINEIAAQIHLFFAAGYESASSLISYCSYLLAKHPEAQKKVQLEIDEVLRNHNGEVSYDALMDMEYLECCLNETLRMFTPIPLLNRECTSDYTLPGTDTVIKKGTAILIPLTGIHYDPKYYKDPTEFRPERFLNGEVSSNAPYFLPFGDGPRICPGIRMALIEAKLALAMIMSKFNVHLGEHLQKNEVKICAGSIVPIPKGGLHLKVSRRE